MKIDRKQKTRDTVSLSSLKITVGSLTPCVLAKQLQATLNILYTKFLWSLPMYFLIISLTYNNSFFHGHCQYSLKLYPRESHKGKVNDKICPNIRREDTIWNSTIILCSLAPCQKKKKKVNILLFMFMFLSQKPFL